MGTPTSVTKVEAVLEDAGVYHRRLRVIPQIGVAGLVTIQFQTNDFSFLELQAITRALNSQDISTTPYIDRSRYDDEDDEAYNVIRVENVSKDLFREGAPSLAEEPVFVIEGGPLVLNSEDQGCALIGHLEDPETLSMNGEAYDDKGGTQGMYVTLKSWDETTEDDRHGHIKMLENKKLRITIEVLPSE